MYSLLDENEKMNEVVDFEGVKSENAKHAGLRKQYKATMIPGQKSVSNKKLKKKIKK